MPLETKNFRCWPFLYNYVVDIASQEGIPMGHVIEEHVQIGYENIKSLKMEDIAASVPKNAKVGKNLSVDITTELNDKINESKPMCMLNDSAKMRILLLHGLKVSGRDI